MRMQSSPAWSFYGRYVGKAGTMPTGAGNRGIKPLEGYSSTVSTRLPMEEDFKRGLATPEDIDLSPGQNLIESFV